MPLDLPYFILLYFILFCFVLLVSFRKILPVCFIEVNVQVALGVNGLKSSFVASLTVKLDIAALENH